MALRFIARAAVVASCATAALSAESQAQVAAQVAKNPIRKVVTLLQAMQKKVVEEGEKEKALFDQYMCYCKNGAGDLEASIAAAETKGPQVGAEIEATEQRLEQAKADLTQAQTDRASAEQAMQEATSLREKEAAAFAAQKAEADTNIQAVNKAVAALERGAAGGFLQTGAARVIQGLVESTKVDMLDADRQDLMAFLEQRSGYSPQSGQVTGILKQLGDTMSKDLADATANEEQAVKNYGELMDAKKKEVSALSRTVETKTTQIGELGVALVQAKEDLSDSEATLVEDRKFLEELQTGCRTKGAEWESRSKMRAEELVALADTIKVLNDDDALDLFKKTLPSAGSSLLQLRVAAADQQRRALVLLNGLRKASMRSAWPALDLMALTLTGHKAAGAGGFEKVIKLIDDMIVLLSQEQADDSHKKEYCASQFDSADDQKKGLERSVADEDTAIANTKEGIETLTQEIAALEAGIKALDKMVAEATENRKAENAEYKELMASDSSAKELLGFAKNRLNKFYNPNLYKAPPKQELSAEDRIFVNNGGTPPPTQAPGALLAQVSAHSQLRVRREAPSPPPATWAAYSSKSEESNGVIAMLDLLIKDMDKEMTEAEVEEKNAQHSYEALMVDSADKRTEDSKSLTSKGAAKAGLETELQEHGEAKKSAVEELMATEKYIASLHAECDWLIQYFDVRKAARTDEIDSLGRAKAVLSGADYSLVQVRARGYLRHSK